MKWKERIVIDVEYDNPAYMTAIIFKIHELVAQVSKQTPLKWDMKRESIVE